MKSITKIYLVLFLFYGFIFGLLMSIWNYVDAGEISLLKTVFMIIFFGGFMSWSSVRSIKKSKQKFRGEKLTEKDFKLSHSEIIAKNKSIHEIYDLLKSNEVTKDWKIKNDTINIVGRTNVSLTSWGERIIIRDLNDKIEIISKPVLITTILDNGKNRENVLFLKELIAPR